MSFDRIAPSYRALEWMAFSNVLQRARTAFISQAVDSRCALLVGEGDGRFLAELLQRNPKAEIDCIDASAAMIQRAHARAAVTSSKARDLASVDKRVARSLGVRPPQDDTSSKLGELSRLNFYHADILDSTPPRKSYDLVVTHFFLDCFNRDQLSGVIAKLARSAAPRSCWLVSDFAMPKNGFRSVHAKIWLRAMYSFFGAVAALEAHELVDPSSFIQDTGFQLRREIVTHLGLVKAQLWERGA